MTVSSGLKPMSSAGWKKMPGVPPQAKIELIFQPVLLR
jgi:hypothetical protein